MGRLRIFLDLIQKSKVLIFLTILPLILLIFWLVRIRFTDACVKMAVPCGGDVCSLRSQACRWLRRSFQGEGETIP
jgi:hypothetical protein